MSATEIIAEIRSLPQIERNAVLAHLLGDRELREDLQDALVIDERRDEPSRPLDDVLQELGE